MKIWKLLGLIAFDLAAFLLAPTLLVQLGLVPALLPRAWFVLGCAAVILILETILGDIVSGKSSYHQHGFEICVTTMGASLSGAAAQMVTEGNLFPGLNGSYLTKVFMDLHHHETPAAEDVVDVLFAVFVLSILASLLTAWIAKAADNPKTPFKSGLGLVNFTIGFCVFGWYTFVVIAGA